MQVSFSFIKTSRKKIARGFWPGLSVSVCLRPTYTGRYIACRKDGE